MKIPRIKIAHLPTAVESLPRLSAELGGPQIWIKRDDQTGLALGGNKTRKLEFLLAEAQAHGARTLVTGGAAQSNHCRQTAAAAARFGFGCILVLSGETPISPSGNLLLDQLFEAEIVWTSPEQRNELMQQTFRTAWKAGRRPYMIPYGGSNSTGAVAYTFALQELLEQGDNSGVGAPDWIICASSSGGTQAGLAVGARLNQFQGQILGISVDESEAALKEKIAGLATATAELLDEQITFTPEEILVNADYLGGGYGVVGAPEREAIHLFARQEGVLLDPVYTGRAAAGLIDLIRRDFFSRRQVVLFWHTGGTPALFAEGYQGKL